MLKFSFAAAFLATVVTVATVRAARAELSIFSPVSINGIGGIKVGMTPRQAAKETGLKLEKDASGEEECYYLVPSDEYFRGIAFMVTSNKIGSGDSIDRIARVDITNSAIRTKSGVSIGDTESEVRRTYPGLITADKEYDSRTLIYTPREAKDRNFRIVFLVDRGKVASYRAGKIPEVLAVEHCL
jgi:hypothetical protein